MRVIVLSSAAEAQRYPFTTTTTTVVIDVLRATSVIVTAFSHGALAIHPAEEVTEAEQMVASWPRDQVLLAGERNSLPLPGFDVGNSPLDFTEDRVRDKHVIMTTTNGTRALIAAEKAGTVLVGCLLNATAVAEHVRHADDIVLLCSGSYNVLDISDAMAAAAIIDALQKLGCQPQLGDLGLLCAHYYDDATYKQRVRASWHGNRLIERGMGADVEYCLQRDLLPIVPVCADRNITLDCMSHRKKEGQLP